MNKEMCPQLSIIVMEDYVQVKTEVEEHVAYATESIFVQDGITENDEYHRTDSGLNLFSERGFKKLKESHVNIKYLCTQCDKSFSYKKTLQKHIDRDSCSFCEKHFRDKRWLKTHENRHQKLTYVCTKCKRLYETKEELDYHKKHHGKSFDCSACGRQFSSYGNLNIHINSVHSVANIACNHCSAMFTRKSSMQEHIEIIHLKIKHPCLTCSHEAKSKSNLKAHMKLKHK